MHKSGVLAYAAQFAPRLFQVRRSTWITVGVGLLVLFGVLIWAAIVKSSWAGAKGGLGALSLVKTAKRQLEQAIRQNPSALDGSAYTSLGSLYYQVPGWPVGFGDKAKAEQLLKQALAFNPNGIDPNFFYGDYLLEE